MAQIPKSFLRSVSILFTGTAIAQLISYIVTPVITRQYSPEESAYLGLFLRITALGAAIATARLELAFPLEKENHHAFGIYRFSIRFSILISLIALILVFIFSGIKYNSLQNFLFLISLPIGLFLTAFLNQGASWSLRNEEYLKISYSNLLLSTFSNGFKIVFGFISGNFLFLIGATLIGYLAATFSFFKDYVKNKKNNVLTWKSKRTQVLIAKNSNLYKYNLPHVIVDLARDLLFASIIWNYYGKMEYGSYDHAFRMLKLPVVFIGSAVGQVFFKRCSVLIQEKKNIFPLVSKICVSLIGISIVPFIIIGFFGSDIFSFVFGEKWKLSGEMGAIMTPWLFTNFIVSPISHIPVLLNKQKAFFWINLIGTLSMILIVSIPYLGIYSPNFQSVLLLVSISQAVFLTGVLVWLLWLVRPSNQNK